MLDFNEKVIQQSREALDIYERLDDMIGQAGCLNCLARLLLDRDPESADPYCWHDRLFWIHHWLEELFCSAHTQIGQAKCHTVDEACCLGHILKPRLVFGVENAGLKAQHSGLCVQPKPLRSEGSKGLQRTPPDYRASDGKLVYLW